MVMTMSQRGGVMPNGTARRRTEKISEVIARDIIHDIVSNDLKPGDMLPAEAAMTRNYGVGRGSLREALRILEVQGLIQIRPGPGGGPVVNAIDPVNFGRLAALYFHVSRATLRELLDARMAIEPVLAGLAASSSDEAARAELKDHTGRAREAAARDTNAYRALTMEFHYLITGMSGNRVLDLFGRALKDIYSGRVHSYAMAVREQECVLDDHEAIAQAILERDPVRAHDLMEAHMKTFARLVESTNPTVLAELIDWQ
jgi:GntR family transcriptional repressor for pyruvate dehydrogenase complex